jgi:hypothetical protein
MPSRYTLFKSIGSAEHATVRAVRYGRALVKGFFSQGVAVLFSRAPTIERLHEQLSMFAPRGPTHLSEVKWPTSGPSVRLPFREEVNGFCTVDVVSHPWPDAMGSPEAEAEIFMAWGIGAFGPYAYPSGLERACQQSWAWKAAGEVVSQHRAFVRARISYAFSAPDDACGVPRDCVPVDELQYLDAVVAELSAVEGALCFYNPNADLVVSPEMHASALLAARADDLLPLELWTNVRLFRIEDQAGRTLMDTTGMAQLDLPDQEMVVPEAVSCDEVASFLRGTCQYLVGRGDVIADGHTADGPGGVLRAVHREESVVAPPRPVTRWEPAS